MVRLQPFLCNQLFRQQLLRTPVFQSPHGFAIAPDQVLSQLLIQLIYTSERLPIVKISLVIPMAALNFSIVPQCPRRYQFVRDPQFSQLPVKGTFLCIADVLVGKLCPVVCLHRLDLEGQCLYQQMQELD